jgi:hypothetical protein
MSRLRFSIRRIDDTWYVFYGARRDPDIEAAFRWSIKRRAISTQRKVARFIETFLNFECFDGEPHDAFLVETFQSGRERVETFLEALGFEVADGNREDDAKHVRIGNAGSVSGLPCCLKALTRIYGRLSSKGLRPKANPCKIDNWHLLPPETRRALEDAIYGKRLQYGSFSGSQYIVVAGPSYAIRMENPIGLGARVLDAGRRFGWPDAILDQVTVMDDEGARWVDTFDLNAADWGEASNFGRKLRAPNKGSSGERVKTIVISLSTADQIKASFDRDPKRPNFSELERLFADRNLAALKAIPLFPSRTGRPFSYHVFNNDYFRPAMTAFEVNIVSETSIARATAHRIRAGMLQEEAQHIYRDGRTDDEIREDLSDLQKDAFIKSPAALNRYIGRVKKDRAERVKAERHDARKGRRANAAAPPAQSIPDGGKPLTALQRRLMEMKK